jgi:hypothetical protein
MSKSIILARSPFLIEVNEDPSDGSKIEIFIWNGTGSAPVSPNYVLSKFVASPTNFLMRYDISNYIREYIKNEHPYTDDTDFHWCNVKVKRYNLVTGTYTLLDTTEYYAVDGYVISGKSSYNNPISDTTITIGNNYSNTEINYFCSTPVFNFINGNGYYLEWDEIGGEGFGNYTIDTDNPIQYNGITLLNFEVSVYNSSDELIVTYTFKSEEICTNYSEVTYINKYGFFESSCMSGSIKYNMQVNANSYQLYQTNFDNYAVEAEKQEFNKNGVHSFTINTNWKPESWNIILQQIMLSEKLLLTIGNDATIEETEYMPFPVKLNTNQTQLFRHINDKLINYQLEFEYLKALVYTNM